MRIPLIIGNVILNISSLANLPPTQLFIETIDNIIISIIMVLLQLYILRNWEEYRLPFKMKDNKANYLFKKKHLPNQAVVAG